MSGRGSLSPVVLEHRLTGAQVRGMFAAATAYLHRNSPLINAINAFPVPDGDTGTNMSLTMRAAMQEAERTQDGHAGSVIKSIARGALLGARGNSGVILSQILNGLSRVLEKKKYVDGSSFALALEQGATTALQAVSRPVEGTILTVIREAAEAATDHALKVKRDVRSVLTAATDGAHRAVARTREMLSVLREAGVVDAGGQGLYVFLDGLRRHLIGEKMDVQVEATPTMNAKWIEQTLQNHATEETSFGFCTEFLITGKKLSIEPIREKMMSIGDSVLVVGDPTLIRVHVHTNAPEAAIEYGASLGSISGRKVDNIQKQVETLAEIDARPFSILAIASSEGFEKLFTNLGAQVVKSAADLSSALAALSQTQVIVLPNDSSRFDEVHTVVNASKLRGEVIETRSLPQGVTAMMALPSDATWEESVSVMRDSLKRAKDGSAAANLESVDRVVSGLVGEETELITLYYGRKLTASAAEAVADGLRARQPGHEVEVVAGLQKESAFLIAVE